MSRIRANNIVNGAGTGAPTFPNGAVINGITTITADVSTTGSNLTIGTGTTISNPDDDQFRILTNGSERLRIDSSGNVGIGTDNPESGSKLTVNGGIFVKNYLTAATIHGGGIDYVNDGRGTRITSYGASGAKTAISFAQGNGGSGASEIARFDTNGNLVFASSGQGIDFSAASGSAAGSTSAVLDDYEEGTWNPTIRGTTAGTATYAEQHGSYIKIGKAVTVTFYLQWSSGTGSGVMYVGNLPFTTANNFDFISTGAAMLNLVSYTGDYVVLYSGYGSTNLPLFVCQNNTVWSNVDYDAAGSLIGSITYQVD